MPVRGAGRWRLTPTGFYQDRPLNIAHRGARRQAPENTLPAFQRAVSLGVDGVELDVRLTADSIPVVIHDRSVDRLTDGSGFVADMTFAQLSEVDAGVSFGRQYAGTRIPALSEVLETVGKRVLLNVELKPNGGDVRLAGLVARMVLAFGLAETVLISSFSSPLLDEVRAAAPEIGVGLLLPPGLVGWLTNGPSRSTTAPYDALHPHYRMVNRPFVRRAHLNGCRVNVWKVDTLRAIRRMVALHVDMIIGDSPELVKGVLAGGLS
jgi:glycerophosphoryl diester phosphodiesterase